MSGNITMRIGAAGTLLSSRTSNGPNIMVPDATSRCAYGIGGGQMFYRGAVARLMIDVMKNQMRHPGQSTT